MAKHAPRLVTITLTSANTNYNLYTLLAAIDADVPIRCQFLTFQVVDDGGAQIVRIGNVDLSDTVRGADLTAGQSDTIFGGDSNLIFLKDIFLRCTLDGKTVNVTVLTR